MAHADYVAVVDTDACVQCSVVRVRNGVSLARRAGNRERWCFIRISAMDAVCVSRPVRQMPSGWCSGQAGKKIPKKEGPDGISHISGPSVYSAELPAPACSLLKQKYPPDRICEILPEPPPQKLLIFLFNSFYYLASFHYLLCIYHFSFFSCRTLSCAE